MDRPGTTSARLIGRAQDGRCLDDLIYPMTRTSTTITQRHAQYCAVVIQWKFFVVLLHWIDTQHEYYSGEYCISTRNESTRANWKLLTRDELRQDWSRGESERGMGLPKGGNLQTKQQQIRWLNHHVTQSRLLPCISRAKTRSKAKNITKVGCKSNEGSKCCQIK